MRRSVIRYSAEIGKNPQLVQGAGGNVSWKDGDTLWIKASGTWLADAEGSDIFVPVDLCTLQDNLQRGNFAFVPEAKNGSSLRPSIETLLHGLMPQSVVVHVHALDVVAFLVQRNFREVFQARLGGKVAWAAVDYFKPGADLAEAVQDGLLRRPDADVVFLANHGLVIGGDSVVAVEETLQKVLNALAHELPKPLLPTVKISPALASHGYCVVDAEEVQQLALNEQLLQLLQDKWVLYPDHVVFLGEKAEVFEAEVDLIAHLEAGNVAPDYAIIAGRGVFLAEGISGNKEALLRFYAALLARVMDSEQIEALSDRQIGDLLNWDAEKFRQKVAR